jgi:hypothetical protein
MRTRPLRSLSIFVSGSTALSPPISPRASVTAARTRSLGSPTFRNNPGSAVWSPILRRASAAASRGNCQWSESGASSIATSGPTARRSRKTPRVIAASWRTRGSASLSNSMSAGTAFDPIDLKSRSIATLERRKDRMSCDIGTVYCSWTNARTRRAGQYHHPHPTTHNRPATTNKPRMIQRCRMSQSYSARFSPAKRQNPAASLLTARPAFAATQPPLPPPAKSPPSPPPAPPAHS